MKLFKKAKKGFTLIELVVVIAVIAILSAVSVVAYVGITNNAKKSVAQQEADKMKTMLRAELTRAEWIAEYGKATTEDTSDDATYKIVLDAENDRIKASMTGAAANQEGLDVEIEKLIVQAQGFEEESKCSYVYAKRVGSAYENESAEKFVIKFEDSKLKLFHPNEKVADIIEVLVA